MFSNDLQVINKEDNQDIFYLVYEDQFIQCSDSEDLVQDSNRELLWFIIEDLDRFGDFDIKNKKLILDQQTPNAYYIFSAQKLMVENKLRLEKFIDELFGFFVNDLILVQVANGGAEEVREVERLLPVRSAIINYIGNEKFDSLTSYAWDAYYSRFDLEISKDDTTSERRTSLEIEAIFRKDNLSKEICELFILSTNAEKACIITLFYCLDCRSILLPIAFIKKWITKREFIAAAMGFGGNIVDTASVHGSNKDHNNIYKYFDQFAVICSDYIDASIPLLLNKISQGESKKIEFKESLSLDVRKQRDKLYQPKKEKYIEDAVLKTIAGFLNSDGGELFIGIDDQSKVLGIQHELDIFHKSSNDKILLHLKNLIKSNIGAGFSNFYDVNIRNMDNKKIIHVECSKSPVEVFIRGKDFYVRSGPSTERLEGKELILYTKKRFL